VSDVKPRIKAVLDSNVAVSALLFGGTPRRVTDLISLKKFRPVMSEEMMTELRRIIYKKFAYANQDLQIYERLLERYALWVTMGTQTVTICRDPDDDKFIETALIAGCQYIISGDNDLLAIGTYKTIKILTPAEFLKWMA
jgi:putative PIN family toxin of toxin-antitoxin system